MIRILSHSAVSRFAANYGMLGVLVVLCVYYSVATYQQQKPLGEDAARVLARDLIGTATAETAVLIAAKTHQDDVDFSDSLAERLEAGGVGIVGKVNGSPVQIRREIQRITEAHVRIDVIAAPKSLQKVIANICKGEKAPAGVRIAVPEEYWWPTFLKIDNLLVVAKGVVVIAVIAVGMTMVIITGGIDLSVGSLVALSAVLTAEFIVASGGPEATVVAMLLCCLAAIAICAAMGAFSGLMITAFQIPPFIATLAMMEVARGLALRITRSQSVSGLPASFDWLGLRETPVAQGDVGLVMTTAVVVLHVCIGCRLAAWAVLRLRRDARTGAGKNGPPRRPAAVSPAIGRLASLMRSTLSVAWVLSLIVAPVSTVAWAAMTLTRYRVISIPNSLILMIAIFAIGHLVMSRTSFGRHIYAIGGNRQAAKLSGIRVGRVLLIVYVIAAAMAGLGGVIEASKFTSGDPKSGLMYELQVIAAVVVGGTSLAGGEGRVLGTLIGAFIIAVIKNGMNLTNIESNTQRIVLGLAILAAVLLDMLRKRGWCVEDVRKLIRWVLRTLGKGGATP